MKRENTSEEEATSLLLFIAFNWVLMLTLIFVV